MAGETDTSELVVLLVGSASGVFAAFCPSWFTTSSDFFHEQDARAGNIRRMRYGEAAGTAIVVGMGAAISSKHHDPVPLVASIAISAIVVGGYEWCIAHPAKDDNGACDEDDTYTDDELGI
jgi:hypothetical protein